MRWHSILSKCMGWKSEDEDDELTSLSDVMRSIEGQGTSSTIFHSQAPQIETQLSAVLSLSERPLEVHGRNSPMDQQALIDPHPGNRLSESSAKIIPTPPATPVEEANPSLRTLAVNPTMSQNIILRTTILETSEDCPLDDEIFGTFHDNHSVSFQISKPSNVHFRATICLDDYEVRGYGPIPQFANGYIAVLFHFKNWKVWKCWVSVPYSYAKFRVPQLPSLPETDSCHHAA